MPGVYQALLDAGPPLGYCYPELGFEQGSHAPFGYNHTHPDEPMAQPWRHYLSHELGANPEGVKSAAIPSLMREAYEMGGFAAVIIPFFSEIFLFEERGLCTLEPACHLPATFLAPL